MRAAPAATHLKDTMAQQNALVWEDGTVMTVRPVSMPESRLGWIAVDIATPSSE
jgi:hypothetical protein